MSVSEELKALLDMEDYPGLGNLMLEMMMRPHQDTKPDADALLLEKEIQGIIAHRYKIPMGLKYGMPLRDKYIPWEERGVWEKDGYVQLIVIAYMFGATIENLPPPYGDNVLFYRMVGVEQSTFLYRAYLEWRTQKRMPPDKEFEVVSQLHLRDYQAFVRLHEAYHLRKNQIKADGHEAKA